MADGDDIRAMVERIDERTESILYRLQSGDTRMDGIERRLINTPCGERGEKIKTLERLTWGTIGAVCLLMLHAFWDLITGGPHG